MALQAPAKSNLQNDSSEVKAATPRRLYDPLGFTRRSLSAVAPFSLMIAEDLDLAFMNGNASSVVWKPSIDVCQRKAEIAVRAQLPGLTPNDVKVEVIDGALVIEGERKSAEEENDRGVYRSELRYGRFLRGIPLPEDAKVHQARAKFENGVLEISVPSAEPVSDRRQIPVEAASQISIEKKNQKG